MKIKLIDIGNSKGIRIPKSFIEKCGFKDELEIDIKQDKVIITSVKKTPRKGWAQSFKKMRENDDDQLIIDNLKDCFEDEWDW
jgi:antitoxin MazE